MAGFPSIKDEVQDEIVDVNIVSGGSSSGTQYTEGDTDASITGGAILWEDSSDTLRVVSAATPLPVEIITGRAGGTQYTEDAAAPANPVGTALSMVRADSLAGLTTTDGDNVIARGTDKGELYVKHVDSIPVTSSTFATAAKQDTMIGHLDGVETSLTSIDTDTTTIIGHLDGVESLLTDIEAAVDGLEAKDYATSAKQDTIIDHVDGIESAVDQIEGYVDGIEGLLTTIDVDTGNIATSLSMMDDWDNAASDGASVSGDTAHDAADAGEPVKVGFKAESSPKGITLVTDGDRTDAYADLDGLQMTKLNTSFADIISERVSNTDGSSTALTNFSAVASTKNYVTSIVVYNSSSSAGFVDFRDGTAGSVLWTMPLPANSGSVISSASPLFKTSANTALAYDVSAALTTVYISLSGFQSKV